MKVWTIAAWALLSFSCAPPPKTPSANPPPVHDPPPPPCAAAVEMSEGTWTTVEVPASSVLDAAGLEATVDAGKVSLHAAYGSGGPHPVTIACGDRHGIIDVQVRKLVWSNVTTWHGTLHGPPAREYGTMWIDEADPDRLLVFGGFHYVPVQFTPAWDLWSYDLAANVWTQLTPSTEPPHFPGGTIAPVPGERAMLYLGGDEVTAEGDNTPRELVRFDYAPDRLAFSDMPHSADSPESFTGSLVYDAPRKRWLSVCGAGRDEFTCAPWAYTPADGWSRLPLADGPAPEPREGFFRVYDEQEQRFVIFSGDLLTTDFPGRIDQRTWSLDLSQDPARWVQLIGPQDPPMGRRNGAQAYDPEGHRLFVWGGTNNGATSMPGLYVLDLDRGHESWTQLDLPDSPPTRSSGMGVYDAKRKRIVFGFGNGPEPKTDLWALQL